MPKFPLHFAVEAKATEGISSHWECFTDGLTPIKSSIPPEFAGPGGGYSPEDLMGLALLNCLIATFKVYAEKSGLHFKSLHSKASLIMDIDASIAKMHIPEIHIDISIEGASDVEKIRKTLNKAISDCAISNSIKSGKTFTLNIS